MKRFKKIKINKSLRREFAQKTLKILLILFLITSLTFLIGLMIRILFPTWTQIFFTNLEARIHDFYHFWDFEKWSISLGTLIITYYAVGTIYDYILFRKTGMHWISPLQRALAILVDLIANVGIGIYYVWSPDTVIGALMAQCPIAMSPFFFLIEMICFHIYYLSLTNPKWISFFNTNKKWIRFAAPFKKLVQRMKERNAKIKIFFNKKWW